MGCDRPSATGWLKNTRRLISHHDFKIGCDPPSATGWLKIQGGSSPTVISELVVTPLLQQGGSKNTRWFMSHYDFKIGCGPLSASGWLKKYKVVYLPVWFQYMVWPPFFNREHDGSKMQGGSSPTIISRWGLLPSPPYVKLLLLLHLFGFLDCLFLKVISDNNNNNNNNKDLSMTCRCSAAGKNPVTYP